MRRSVTASVSELELLLLLDELELLLDQAIKLKLSRDPTQR